MTSSGSRVFIRLMPLDTFFFGGVRTFGENNADYFVRSNLFPQQTALVGLLRYQLRLKGLDFGEDSFRADRTEVQTYGLLQSLSPVFLYHQAGDGRQFDTANAYWQHPLDAHKPLMPFRVQQPAEAQWLKPTGAAAGKDSWEWAPATLLEGYEAKESLVEEVWLNNRQNQVDKGQVFAPLTRVGITKRRRGDASRVTEQGFYKQLVYKLCPGWSFGCIATFGEGFDPAVLDGSVSPFGGERSLFRLEAWRDAPDWSGLAASLSVPPFYRPGQNCFVLLSDARVSPAVYEHCAVAVTRTADFQHLITPRETTRFAAMATAGQPRDALYKSGKYNLLRRGSVLYARPGAAGVIEEALTQPNFHNIGYNHYLKS